MNYVYNMLRRILHNRCDFSDWFRFSWLVSFINDDDIDESIYFAWVLSSIGFGVCLTYILFNRGII